MNLAPLLNRDFLCTNFCFFYRVIVASAPLLEFAIPRSKGELLDYYKKHLEEETGHDEMMKDDLSRLGIKEIPYFHRAAQLAGSQYYLLAHDDPALLLGYMHALEKNLPSVEFVDDLSKLHGTELTALRHHAVHDAQHKIDLESMISRQSLPLQRRIKWNEDAVDKFMGQGW